MKKVKICGLRRKEDILIVNRLKQTMLDLYLQTAPEK